MPGSHLTTAEITNDPGLLQMQNTARAKNQAPFQAQAQQNNAMRVGALNSLAPGNASPQMTAQFFRQQLDSIDAAQQAVVDGATAHAATTLGAVGGTGVPEDYGNAARQSIQQNYAGPLADSAQAEQLAQQSLAQHLGTMGGEPSSNPGADQARYGAGIRNFVQEGRNAAQTDVNCLWNTARQNGDISFDPAPAAEGVQTALGGVNTAGGDVLRPGEQRLYDLIQGWHGPQDFGTLTSMRSNVGAEANAAAREGDRQALARLQGVKGGIDSSLDAAIQARVASENAAVQTGALAPENTLAASFGSVRNRFSGAGGENAVARPAVGGNPAPAPADGSNVGSAGIPGVDGAGVSPTERAGGAPGNPSLPGAGSAAQAQPAAPSLLSFLISRGGLQDQGGELASMDARLGRVGLVRKPVEGNVPGQGGLLGTGTANGRAGAGMSLDYAREAAEQAGYLRPGSDINDFLDSVRTELSGHKVYPVGEGPASADASRNAADMQRAHDQVSMAEDDLGMRISRAEHTHAAELVAQGAHPHDAIDQATRATQEQVLSANAARNAFGEPGAAGARQIPLDVPTPPAPTYTPDARGPEVAQAYADARAGTRGFHQTYSDSATGDVLQRGPFGGPSPMADADVPAAYWHTGKDALADAKNYIDAVKGRPEAIRQLQQYAAFDLRRNATNPNGTLNIANWNRWMSRYSGPMAAFPEVREQFAQPALAQQRINEVQQQRNALQGQLQDALGDSAATMIGKYFKPGPAGADGARAFQRETGHTPDAQDALTGHVAANFRTFAAPDGVANPARAKMWIQRFTPALEAMPDDVRARFEDAQTAADTLAKVTRDRTQAVQDYQNGAARFWLKNDPSQAVAKALGDKGTAPQNMADMVGAVKGDSAAQLGLKRAVLDHLMGRTIGNLEAGDTGTNFLRSDAFQTALRPDGLRPALAKIFSPEEMKTLDAVATDLQQANRSVCGSKAPNGPGTARDIHGLGRFGAAGQSLLTRLVGAGVRSGGMLVGHLVAGGPEGIIGGSAAGEVVNDLVREARAAKQERIADLLTGAILDPEQGRILLSRAQGQSTVPLVKRLTQRMGQIAASYPGR